MAVWLDVEPALVGQVAPDLAGSLPLELGVDVDVVALNGAPLDPVVALWAETRGGSGRKRPRPGIAAWLGVGPAVSGGERAQLDHVRRTGTCPHCGDRLRLWEVPVTPFTEWDTSHLLVCFNDSSASTTRLLQRLVCFNDACPYLLSGGSAMGRQGNRSTSYRFAWHRENGILLPLSVTSW